MLTPYTFKQQFSVFSEIILAEFKISFIIDITAKNSEFAGIKKMLSLKNLKVYYSAHNAAFNPSCWHPIQDFGWIVKCKFEWQNPQQFHITEDFIFRIILCGCQWNRIKRAILGIRMLLKWDPFKFVLVGFILVCKFIWYTGFLQTEE